MITATEFSPRGGIVIAPPWDEANSRDGLEVARMLGFQHGRERRKFPCNACASSDGAHAYPNGGHYCFSCGRYYSNVDLAAAVWGIAPHEAAFKLTGQIPPAPPSPIASQATDKTEHRRKLREAFGEFVARADMSTWAARYLEGRGIRPASAWAYGLRSIDSRAQWAAVRREIEQRTGFDVEAEAGLSVFQWACPCIVLPYWDGGEVVGLRARGREPGDRPKYVSPKGHGPPCVFNVEALDALQASDTMPSRLLVCEGELDTLLAEQVGECAAGLPGASPSRAVVSDLVERLEYAPKVVIVADPDEAGARGAERLVEAIVNRYGGRWVTERVEIWQGMGDFTETMLWDAG